MTSRPSSASHWLSRNSSSLSPGRESSPARLWSSNWSLAQIHGIRQQRPDLGVLPALAGRLQAALATTNARAAGASSLTAAELRLLPLLSTHLSYQEIGERLHVPKNTVKTQAYSAYRKLGVSSRSEAVLRARELGLDVL